MKRALAVLVLVAATACGGDLAFVAPAGLEALGPGTAPVPLPVLLTWSPPDAPTQALLDGGQRYFVVFVDRSPVAPGASIADLVDDDCRDDGGCSDQAYFADLGVYVTREPQVLLTRVADQRTSPRPDAVDRHVATVVLADDDGVRRGEIATTIPFTVDRAAS